MSLIIVLPILFFIQEDFWKLNLFDFNLLERENPYNVVVAGASLILYMVALLYIRKTDCRERNYSSVVLGLFFALSFSYLFGSVIVYDQDPLRIWRVMFWFSGLFMYYYLMRTSGYLENAKTVFRILIIYALAAAIFSVLVAYIRPLGALLAPSAVGLRFGMERFIVFEDGIALAYYFFLSRFIVARQAGTGSKGRLINFAGIVFTLFCLVFVGLSRQRIGSIMVVTTGIAMLSSFLPGFKKLAGIWLILAVLAFIIIGFGMSNFMDRFMSSLNTSAHSMHKDDANLSVYSRQQGLKFYYDQFVRTHFIGIGWISSVSNTKESSAIAKANSQAGIKLVDLGIFEVIFRWSIFGLLVYMRFMWVALRQAKYLFQRGDAMTRVIALAIGMFLTAKIVSANTIFFFPGHCLFYAVIMYVLDTMFQSLRRDLSLSVAADNGAVHA